MLKNLFSRNDPDKEFAKETQRKEQDSNRDNNIIANELNPAAEQMYREQQAERNDLLKWQQDLDSDVFDLVMQLQGYRLNGNKYEYVLEEGEEPLCNSRFIHEVVIPNLKPFMGRNIINSNLDTNSIHLMLRSTADDIADAMADGFYRYKIDFCNFDIVLRMIKNTLIPSPYRALNGFTKKTDSTMSKMIENYTRGEEKEKRLSLFSR